MSSTDKAAKVIDEWTQEGGELNSAVGSPHAIAERLAKAGLLAPDLPERPDDGVWGEEDGILADTSIKGDVAILPPYPGVVVLTPQKTRETAYNLLAAANKADEEEL